MENSTDRRSFLIHSGIALAGATALSGAVAVFGEQKQPGKEKEEEVTPVEDLGQEHGLLNRVLLIYDEAERRLNAKADFDTRHVSDAAGIIRSFIEEYHEKQEEDFLFPRFEKAKRLTDLVAVLRQQHQAGRMVTAQILQLASGTKSADDRKRLADSMARFVRMYRPHEAREDTVLFPALRKIVSRHEYDALGEDFEKREHQAFGEDGFEHMLDKVAGIEKSMGIYDLNQFTPR